MQTKRLSKELQKCIDEDAEGLWIRYRWENGMPVCPYCHSHEHQYHCKDGRYKCAYCNRRYSSLVGTVFQNSKLGIKKILQGIFFLLQQQTESAVHFSATMDIKYDTAYLFLKRLHMATNQNLELCGKIAIDEVYLGGRWKNKHYSTRLKVLIENHIIPQGQTHFTLSESAKGMAISKHPVFGENDGKHIRLQQLPYHFDGNDLKEIFKRTCSDVTLCVSDDSALYNGWDVPLEINCHSKKQYRTPNGHSSNAIEATFAHLRRRIENVHIHYKEKFLQLYLNWYAFTWNYSKQSLTDMFAALMQYISSRICRLKDVLVYDALAEYRERERQRMERDLMFAKGLLQQAGPLVQKVTVNGRCYTWDMINSIN